MTRNKAVHGRIGWRARVYKITSQPFLCHWHRNARVTHKPTGLLPSPRQRPQLTHDQRKYPTQSVGYFLWWSWRALPPRPVGESVESYKLSLSMVCFFAYIQQDKQICMSTLKENLSVCGLTTHEQPRNINRSYFAGRNISGRRPILGCNWLSNCTTSKNAVNNRSYFRFTVASYSKYPS